MCDILLWKKKIPFLLLSSPFSALYADKPCGSYLIKCGLLWQSIFAWFYIAAICNWCDQFFHICHRHNVLCKAHGSGAVRIQFQLPAGHIAPRTVPFCPVWVFPSYETTSPSPGTLAGWNMLMHVRCLDGSVDR